MPFGIAEQNMPKFETKNKKKLNSRLSVITAKERGEAGRNCQKSVYIDFGYKVGKHTSIPNVGIRVIICIMRQNVKKIPATMVVIVVVVVAGWVGWEGGGGVALSSCNAHNQNQNQKPIKNKNKIPCFIVLMDG